MFKKYFHHISSKIHGKIKNRRKLRKRNSFDEWTKICLRESPISIIVINAASNKIHLTYFGKGVSGKLCDIFLKSKMGIDNWVNVDKEESISRVLDILTINKERYERIKNLKLGTYICYPIYFSLGNNPKTSNDPYNCTIVCKVLRKDLYLFYIYDKGLDCEYSFDDGEIEENLKREDNSQFQNFINIEQFILQQLFPQHILQNIYSEGLEKFSLSKQNESIHGQSSHHLQKIINTEHKSIEGGRENQTNTVNTVNTVNKSNETKEEGSTSKSTKMNTPFDDNLIIRDNSLDEDKNKNKNKNCTMVRTSSQFSDRRTSVEIEQTAREFSDVAIMFLDIVGFTTLASNISAKQTMYILNKLFSKYDKLTDEFDVYKVETAGDCYITCDGIFEEGIVPHTIKKGQLENRKNNDPEYSAKKLLKFAIEVIQQTKTMVFRCYNSTISVRIGLHIGDVITGTIGNKLPKFSIFGDVMNVASRMESTSKPNCIQVTSDFYKFVKDVLPWEKNEDVFVKNKGVMETYICEIK